MSFGDITPFEIGMVIGLLVTAIQSINLITNSSHNSIKIPEIEAKIA